MCDPGPITPASPPLQPPPGGEEGPEGPTHPALSHGWTRLPASGHDRGVKPLKAQNLPPWGRTVAGCEGLCLLICFQIVWSWIPEGFPVGGEELWGILGVGALLPSPGYPVKCPPQGMVADVWS
jgi:hypothetical protein